MAQPNDHKADPTAHTSTGTQANTEHGAAFPPFESDTFLSQLIWLTISFGLLYYLMAKVALPRIESIMHERAQRLSSDLEEAQRMKEEADRAGEAYQTSLREAQNKAGGIVQEARNRLQAEADERRKKQEADLSEKLAASEKTIRESTERAMGNVRGIAAETASAIVERLTGKAPDKADLDKALDGATVH
jgi:F-type H+-transporting ATPase subunit b